MKKLASTWYNMAVVLTVIAVIAGAGLAYVNSITKDAIQQIKAENEAQAVKDVLKDNNVKIVNTVEVDGMTVQQAENGSVAVKAVDPKNASFGGDLTIMVGFDKEGKILGYSILETKETPGLGAKAGEWFQEGGKGSIIGLTPGMDNVSVSKDGGDVDAITASTITSRSFLSAVNAAHQAAVKAGFLTGHSDTVEEEVLGVDDAEYDLMSGDEEEAESYDGASAATQQAPTTENDQN